MMREWLNVLGQNPAKAFLFCLQLKVKNSLRNTSVEEVLLLSSTTPSVLKNGYMNLCAIIA